jgi:hypothetical protein
MLTFCSHAECLDQELRFLVEIEKTVWQQSLDQSLPYPFMATMFREEFAQQAVHREP